MLAFILQRLAQAVPVVLFSTVAVFLLMRLLPGDPAQIQAGPEATPEALAVIRQEMGLNQPLPVQYLFWLSRVARGDLGTSTLSKLPVIRLLSQRIPATLELASAALVLTLLVALPTGILAAIRPGSAVDWLISGLNGIAIAVPGFWLGILGILLFALVLGWLPPGGRGDFARDPLQALRSLILPAFTLSLASAAGVSRLVKSSMLEVLYEDYIRTARAKGLASTVIVVRHALRNALVPVITMLGLQFGRLLGGAIITESVFAWPGLGRLIVDSIGNRDYLVVQASLLLLVLIFILVNLVTDIAYGFLDPRIRVGGRTEG
jgi:ABC-type dipeptide/oligopeptide/nickel transport system permease component